MRFPLAVSFVGLLYFLAGYLLGTAHVKLVAVLGFGERRSASPAAIHITQADPVAGQPAPAAAHAWVDEEEVEEYSQPNRVCVPSLRRRRVGGAAASGDCIVQVFIQDGGWKG
eukprot:RCo007441